MPNTHQPNILFCLFDSLSMADSGLTTEANELPTLSNLCQTSALFTRTYTPCPESSPARASLFTGLDPGVHGLWTNGVTLPSTEQTFAQRLLSAGYSNALVGRYQLSGVSRWTTEKFRHSEFTHTEWAHGPIHRSRQNHYISWLEKTAPEHYSDLFPMQANPDETLLADEQIACLERLPNEFSFNAWVGDRLGHWISRQPRSKPFLAVASFCVGSNFGAEPIERSDGENVHQPAMNQADSAIGKLLEQLNESDQTEDTVVIIASARGNSVPNDDTSVMKERSIKVPLLIHQPSQQKLTINNPISTIDIAPTVLELANTPISPRMQGQSLLHVINGQREPRNWALSRYRNHTKNAHNHWQSALCSESMKFVVRHNEQVEQHALGLYNLDIDPLEKNNLAQNRSHAEDLELMIDQMIDARCAMEDRTEPRIAEF